ncbi:MAG: hypothetical protein L0H26_03825 [Microlunatus sp.]|nr:hypothetical protein [Microlunatus sp.]
MVLAAAGLRRIGHLREPEAHQHGDDSITVVKGLPAQVLSAADMVPAPGQAALALEIHRSLGNATAAAVRCLNDPVAHAETLAERAFLATLEAGCTAPVGALATVDAVRGRDLDLTLAVVIGRTLLSNSSESRNAASFLRRTLSRTTTDPRQFGVEAASSILKELRTPQRARHA